MPWQLIKKGLGLAEGGIVRSGLSALLGMLGLEGGQIRTPGHQRVAFTIAFVALAAKMAKSDGCVARIEADTFKRLYQVAPEEVENVRRIFSLAAEDTSGFESYASQIASLLSDEPRLLRDVYDGLFHIAASDGILHPGEDQFLRRVAHVFGINPAEYRSIRSAFVHETARLGDSPYDVLGVAPTLADDELKARHRQLVREHHPDSLAARGVPPEFHAAAGRKLAVINAAYDAILRERGLKGAMAFESQPG